MPSPSPRIFCKTETKRHAPRPDCISAPVRVRVDQTGCEVDGGITTKLRTNCSSLCIMLIVSWGANSRRARPAGMSSSLPDHFLQDGEEDAQRWRNPLILVPDHVRGYVHFRSCPTESAEFLAPELFRNHNFRQQSQPHSLMASTPENSVMFPGRIFISDIV